MADPLRERYTIASWPWETQEWPTAWDPLLDVVDELWPSSYFTASAFSEPASLDLPIQGCLWQPIPEPQRFCHPKERSKTRERFGLQRILCSSDMVLILTQLQYAKIR